MYCLLVRADMGSILSIPLMKKIGNSAVHKELEKFSQISVKYN